MTPSPPVDSPDPPDSALPDVLHARFMQLNRGRFSRALERLEPSQRRVLNLLPLLLHFNHPSLPGYVPHPACAGIWGYRPTPQQLAEALRLTRALAEAAPVPGHPPAVEGLYLIGSLGTLAQTARSDMDVWVCHATRLDRPGLQALRAKCQHLETWAALQGVELHMFLIEPRSFAQGCRVSQLSAEDCGEAQHYLLLDEFYRTAIWLAGQTPLWWLVPASREQDYHEHVQALLAKGLIRADAHLDLGHLACIPKKEFIGAGFWHLFKGIESPYKTVLKLLLIEVYASEYPRMRCLAVDFKQAVHADRAGLDELDPYVMIYRRVAHYLKQRNDTKRLELLRHSLYLKADRPASATRQAWQCQLLARLTGEWGWDAKQVAALDDRAHWKARQTLTERSGLVSALSHSYRFLLQFAGLHDPANQPVPHGLSVLGRRLYAAFERRAGKIEIINPGLASNLEEAVVTLARMPSVHLPSTWQWRLYAGTVDVAEQAAADALIHRTHHLVELLVWAHCNGVITPRTQLVLAASAHGVGAACVADVLSCLRQTLEWPLETVIDSRLLQPSVARRTLLLANVETDAPSCNEALRPATCTLRSLDHVTLTTWNEVLVRRHEGSQALAHCVRHLSAGRASHAHRPRLQVHGLGPEQDRALGERIEAMLDATPIAPESRLDGLRAQPPAGSLEQVDGHAVNALLTHARADCIQVFHRLHTGFADLYVLDERNQLWYQRQACGDERQLLIPLHRFLQAMLVRHAARLRLDVPHGPKPALAYYRLSPDPGFRAYEVQAHPTPTDDNPCYYEVQALVRATTAGGSEVTWYCDQVPFSPLEHGDRLCAVVAEQILGQRQGAERYPCYLTDLDLSDLFDEGIGSTLCYLHHKQVLERALNCALETLDR
ncbi:class I adenylate cyclase [Pseudomonas entomophila]|uniref:class I adenylate cyclase n=1 Tax=Pseudomonas entomophila TaxID=312306 RepID=UPI0015E41114|nr:class I adenylate cyclase [Pseudomonas entomophila]MBA1189054.1 class I adenylate cyclase [Pseudomonas entomophila]